MPTWTILGGRELAPVPFLIAGIVNVTPDSFSDGGRFLDVAAAVAHGLRLAEEGAHILDVGGESTRPGAVPVAPQDELARVVPVIRQLRARLAPEVAISVDTFKASVAAAALDAGADIVNDVSACRFDPELAGLLVERKPGYVLMHSLGRPADMQKAPRYADVVGEIHQFFEHHLRCLTDLGLPEDHIVLDPGIGFGKTLEHNLEILRRIGEFRSLGRPVYLGLSMKSLFGKLLGLAVEKRGTATQVATALTAARGANIHRVHDVAATVRTLTLVSALL